MCFRPGDSIYDLLFYFICKQAIPQKQSFSDEAPRQETLESQCTSISNIDHCLASASVFLSFAPSLLKGAKSARNEKPTALLKIRLLQDSVLSKVRKKLSLKEGRVL